MFPSLYILLYISLQLIIMFDIVFTENGRGSLCSRERGAHVLAESRGRTEANIMATSNGH